MTLASSGSISTGNLATEMGVSTVVLPDASTLWLGGKASGSLVLPTDFYSKTWGPTLSFATRFGADSSPGSTWTTLSGGGFAAGDLCIVCQYAESSTGTPPSLVVPATWTQIATSVTFTTSDGFGARVSFLYRILTAPQLGATFTGMNGANRNRCAAIQMHFDRALSSVTIADASTINTGTGAPSNVAPAWDSTRDASHVYIGVAHSENSIADASYTWTTTPDDKGSASVTRTYYKEYANTAPASAITMALADGGTFNAHAGTILRLK